MKFSFNAIFQGLAMTAQVLNQVAPQAIPFLSPKGQGTLAISLSALQSFVGLLAHFYTPTGVKIAPESK